MGASENARPGRLPTRRGMGNRDDVAALVFVDIVRGENVSWDFVGNEYADDYGNRRDDFEEYHRDIDRQLTGCRGDPQAFRSGIF